MCDMPFNVLWFLFSMGRLAKAVHSISLAVGVRSKVIWCSLRGSYQSSEAGFCGAWEGPLGDQA
jgi:hypothetical protein